MAQTSEGWETDMRRALRQGAPIDEVEALLARPDAEVGEGPWLIEALRFHAPTLAGDLDVFERLLDAGAELSPIVSWADVTRRRRAARTALAYAAERGLTDVVARLVDAGAQLVTPASRGPKLLHFAAAGGDVALVERLLCDGVHELEADDDGRRPLHEAAWAGHAEVVELLLARGSEPGAPAGEGPWRGRTPLQLAVEGAHRETVEVLLEGAGPPETGHPIAWLIEARREEGRATLFPEVRETLRVWARTGIAGEPGEDPHLAMGCWLLARFSGPAARPLPDDPLDALFEALDARDLTALHAAIDRAPEDLAARFAEATDEDVLTEVIKAGFAAAVPVLLAAGFAAEPNEDPLSTSPLLAAAALRQRETVGVLLEAGADVERWEGGHDNQDPLGHDALCYALEAGDLELVDLLLGARRSPVDWRHVMSLGQAPEASRGPLLTGILEEGPPLDHDGWADNALSHLAFRADWIEGAWDTLGWLRDRSSQEGARCATALALDAIEHDAPTLLARLLDEADAKVSPKTARRALPAKPSREMCKILDERGLLPKRVATLREAFRRGALEEIPRLLEEKSPREPPLRVAIEEGDESDALAALAARPGWDEAWHGDDYRVLVDAAQRGYFALVRAVLARGRGGGALEHVLANAVGHGDATLVEELLARGVRLRDLDPLGREALSHPRLLARLKEAGTEGGERLAERAIREGAADALEALVPAGRVTEDEALWLAARAGQAELVTRLARRGAAVDGDGHLSRRPVHAIALGWADHPGRAADFEAALAALIEVGAEVRGLLPRLAEVAALPVLDDLAARAGLRLEDDRDIRDRSALHGAAAAGRPDLVAELLARGLDPNARAYFKHGIDVWGRTPLHEAAEDGHVAVVARLLKAGADPGAEDSAGQTPRELTAKRHFDTPEGRAVRAQLLGG